ncbi:unnamed protein product [Prorocentrum cordatum]|uniref:Uncharacterized protein n=1 Tax=Prorocentrum cordatum TaxID=2364126 RepID=A0ABN9UF84_9DINO|nr:unnamed protein product [Polarella glacialis]
MPQTLHAVKGALILMTRAPYIHLSHTTLTCLRLYILPREQAGSSRRRAQKKNAWGGLLVPRGPLHNRAALRRPAVSASSAVSSRTRPERLGFLSCMALFQEG